MMVVYFSLKSIDMKYLILSCDTFLTNLKYISDLSDKWSFYRNKLYQRNESKQIGSLRFSNNDGIILFFKKYRHEVS